MSSQYRMSNTYRIEISGWDLDENFFVEKTHLEWSEEKGKRVQLRRPLRNGAVVFIRLIASVASGQGFPIAYQAELLKEQHPARIWEFRLLELHPHAADLLRESLAEAAATADKGR